MLKVKDATAAAEKFVQRGVAAAKEYSDNVRTSGPEWLARTAESGDTWRDGVTQAITDGRFAKGVQRSGPNKFAERAATIGAQRFPGGIQGSKADWQSGTTPYLENMKTLTLPARGIKGDPRNFLRVQAVGESNHALRLRRLSGAS